MASAPQRLRPFPQNTSFRAASTYQAIYNFIVPCLFAVPAEDVRFVGENKEMSAGHQYEIACQAKGSRPPANITWWKDAISLRGPVRYSVSNSIYFSPATYAAGLSRRLAELHFLSHYSSKNDFYLFFHRVLEIQ